MPNEFLPRTAARNFQDFRSDLGKAHAANASQFLKTNPKLKADLVEVNASGKSDEREALLIQLTDQYIEEIGNKAITNEKISRLESHNENLQSKLDKLPLKIVLSGAGIGVMSITLGLIGHFIDTAYQQRKNYPS